MKTKIFVVSLLAMLLASCSDGKNELSSGTIEDLVEDQLDERNLIQIHTSLTTGTYELNNEIARKNLRELKAAGVIDYTVQRYAWYNKYTYTKRVFSHSEPQYYYGYYLGSKDIYKNKEVTEYNLEEHFIVNVSLTKEGQKHQVDSVPEIKSFDELEDKDIKPVKVDLSEFPEYNVPDEKWPTIPYPGPKEKTTTAKKSKQSQSSSYDETDDIGKNSMDKATVEKYKQALKRVKETTVYLKSFKFDVWKAHNIKLSTMGVSTAKAEVILKVKKATPFGRILAGMYDGAKITAPVSLIYYEDKGWQIDEEFGSGSSNPIIELENTKKGKSGSSLQDDYEIADSVCVDTVAIEY